MLSYSIKGLLVNPGQVIQVEETMNMAEVSLGGEIVSFKEPCQIHGSISNVGGDILRFEGTVNTLIGMHCARCNKPVDYPLHVDISQRFAKRNSEEELAEEEAEPIVNDRIDLEEVIFHEIHLSIPMKVLCREDCKGLCPKCGQDWNEGTCHCETKETDPRWDALKSLFE